HYPGTEKNRTGRLSAQPRVRPAVGLVVALSRRYAVESAPHLDLLPAPSGERRAKAPRFRVTVRWPGHGAAEGPHSLCERERVRVGSTAWRFNFQFEFCDAGPHSVRINNAMKSKSSSLKAVVLGGLLLTNTMQNSNADEGMWLFNNPPRKQLKEQYGFDVTDPWLEHVQTSSVRFN